MASVIKISLLTHIINSINTYGYCNNINIKEMV